MDVEPVVMQRENEVSRVALDGRLIQGYDRCTFVVIHERSGHWAFYPHGDQKFGVRLSQANAVAAAQAILAGAQ